MQCFATNWCILKMQTYTAYKSILDSTLISDNSIKKTTLLSYEKDVSGKGDLIDNFCVLVVSPEPLVADSLSKLKIKANAE